MLRRTIALSVLAVVVAAPAAHATKPCRRNCSGDTTAPTITIGSPSGGATVSGTLAMSGTASDKVALSAVDVAVDNGAWSRASGTTSWTASVNTTTYADGTHTLAARATDTSGNARVTTITVTVRNDVTAPTVAISAPSNGSTVSGSVTVTGSASDNATVTKVETSVDNGAWTTATGTTSWSKSLDTTAYADGTHTVAARATDASGNTRTTTASVTVRNATTTADTTLPTVAIGAPAGASTVSATVTVRGSASDNVGLSKVETSVDNGAWTVATGTTSWSTSLNTTAYANGSHTITARATDTSGNSRTASVTVTVSNSATTQTWTSPEGAKISIDSAGGWTVSQVYQLLKDNAAGPGDFARVAPSITVKVQDQYASQTVTSATQYNGVYSNYSATIWLKGVSSTFASQPDAQLAHEYGHAWTNYHRFLDDQGSWTPYLDARHLAGDSRLDTSYMWDRGEILAEDYRLLFGTATAIAQRPQHMNTDIPDPRNVTGLRDFFLTHWAA